MEKALLMKIMAAVAGAAAVVIGVVVAANYRGGENSYRSILIYEVSGSASIERDGAGTMDAVENLYLESGDKIYVAADSFMRLKLDDDKYVMVEENSVLAIEATGTKADSKTAIRLERGAITNEIQNPLSIGSSYEVTTPNAVMAVRGTVFRVEVYFDKEGEVYTKLSTFEGKVASRLVFPDGTMDEELPVGEGNEVIIYSNKELTEYLRGPEEVVYEDLPLQSLYVLLDLVESGTSIEGTDRETLIELIEGRKQEEPEEKEDEAADKENTSESEEDGEEKEDEKDNEDTNKQEDTKDTEDKKGSEDKEDTGKGDESKTSEDTQGEDSSDTPETQQEDQTYTVTFQYQGQVLGTQKVKHGQKAARPKLQPAASGGWDFDFSKAVTGNMTVEWK